MGELKKVPKVKPDTSALLNVLSNWFRVLSTDYSLQLKKFPSNAYNPMLERMRGELNGQHEMAELAADILRGVADGGISFQDTHIDPNTISLSELVMPHIKAMVVSAETLSDNIRAVAHAIVEEEKEIARNVPPVPAKMPAPPDRFVEGELDG